MLLKRQLIIRALICLALSAQCLLAEAAVQLKKTDQAVISQSTVITTEMRAALQQFVSHYAGNAKGKPRHISQHIYVASVRTENDENTLYAYWKEDQSILIMNFFTHPGEKEGLSWLHRKARVDLKTDVVATEAEMNGSTYLVTRAWADNIIKACRERGQVLVFMSKSRRNK